MFFPSTSGFVYDVIIPALMVIAGVILLLVTNRIHLEIE